MRIRVNGEPTETPARTLAQLCDALGLGDAKIATALNGGFVPVPARAAAELKDSDEVEIVSPRQGG